MTPIVLAGRRRWLVVARGAAASALLAALTAATGLASTINAPVISGLNQHVVPNGFALQITGNHFSNDATGNCDSVGGIPTVHFQPFPGGTFGEQTVQPQVDSQHCTNTMIIVNVPAAVTGAARIVVSTNNSHDSSGGLVPQITIAPTAGLQPSAGGVGTTVQVTGNNFQPPSQVPGSTLQLTFGGSGIGYSGLSNTGLRFTPGNNSGGVQLSFPVCDNASDGCTQRETVSIGAGTYNFNPPSLDTTPISPARVVGDRLTLSGQYLGGGGVVNFPGGVLGQAVSWSSSSIGVTIPPGAQSGTLTIQVTNYNQPVIGPSVSINPKATGMSPTSGSAGQVVRVSGYNFGTGGSVTVAGAGAQVASWADQAVSFVISQDTDGGAVALHRGDGAVVAVANLTIVPHLDRVETPSVPAGSQVVVDGESLGSSQGTATVGSTSAPVLLWSRESVMIQLPLAMAPGTYPVVLTGSSGAASNPVDLTIVAASTKPGASSSPGQSPTGAPVGIGGALAPSFDNNHDFVKPIKPPSPVYFNLTADPHKVKAGEEATLTVTLKLNDKPLKGSAVKLDMLFTPGGDYKFTPDSGVTDDNGTFTAKVRVSKTPGDSVIAATSGVFSDQDHVTGVGANGQTSVASHASPVPNGGFAPLLALGVAALLLVAAGFYLNMRSMGR